MTRSLRGSALAVLLAGCSWTESFVISNESPSKLRVEYELAEPGKDFPIFERQPDACRLASDGDLDWGSRSRAEDLDPRADAVSVDVPPGTALIFGRLSNDEYRRHDQPFINGRVFNLKKLTVSGSGSCVEILPEDFDSFFHRGRRMILFRLR